MMNFLRPLSLGIAVATGAALAPSAMASTVTCDFNNLPSGFNLASSKVQCLDGATNALRDALSFSTYDYTLNDGTPVNGTLVLADKASGGLSGAAGYNGSAYVRGRGFTITFESWVKVDELTLTVSEPSAFGAGVNAEFVFGGSSAGTSKSLTLSASNGDVQKWKSDITVPLAGLGLGSFSSINFSDSAGLSFGVDDLRFSLSTEPGTVQPAPEPASLALGLVALAAAGATSTRRRKQG